MHRHQTLARWESAPLIDPKLIEILRCPQNQSSLSPADEALITRTNKAVDAGVAVNLAGQKLEKHLDGGLIREQGDLMYPVIDGIPVMLADEAIKIDQFAEKPIAD